MIPGRTADAYFGSLHDAVGGRLFTVTVLDRAAGLARRAYSSAPEVYPVSGVKPMAQGAWTGMVVDRGEVFVANSVAEFAVYFPDHALIESLGCGSVLNVPIVENGVIGTVNVLDVAGFFSPPVVARICDEITAREKELHTHLRDLEI